MTAAVAASMVPTGRRVAGALDGGGAVGSFGTSWCPRLRAMPRAADGTAELAVEHSRDMCDYVRHIQNGDVDATPFEPRRVCVQIEPYAGDGDIRGPRDAIIQRGPLGVEPYRYFGTPATRDDLPDAPPPPVPTTYRAAFRRSPRVAELEQKQQLQQQQRAAIEPAGTTATPTTIAAAKRRALSAMGGAGGAGARGSTIAIGEDAACWRLMDGSESMMRDTLETVLPYARFIIGDVPPASAFVARCCLEFRSPIAADAPVRNDRFRASLFEMHSDFGNQLLAAVQDRVDGGTNVAMITAGERNLSIVAKNNAGTPLYEWTYAWSAPTVIGAVVSAAPKRKVVDALLDAAIDMGGSSLPSAADVPGQ